MNHNRVETSCGCYLGKGVWFGGQEEMFINACLQRAVGVLNEHLDEIFLNNLRLNIICM